MTPWTPTEEQQARERLDAEYPIHTRWGDAIDQMMSDLTRAFATLDAARAARAVLVARIAAYDPTVWDADGESSCFFCGSDSGCFSDCLHRECLAAATPAPAGESGPEEGGGA